jgi:hypothetical protein
MPNDVASIRAHYVEVRRARLAYLRWRAERHRTRVRRAGNSAGGAVGVKGGDLPEPSSTPCPSTEAGDSPASEPPVKGTSQCAAIVAPS